MDFLHALQKERLLFDGAMGTMLHAAGVELGDCPELLNVTHPAVVSGVHEQYAKAGAQAVETNSLGLNGISLARHGLQDRLEELTAAAVRCARDGVGDGVFVALSVGPTGDMLSPLGALTADAAYEAYRRQAFAGAEAGADILYIETVSDIAEARLAILAAKEHTSLPVVCSFTYESNGRTLMGAPPTCAAAIALAAGADVMATNCSGGPEQLLGILKETRAASACPMIVQPNAGLPVVKDGKTSFPLGPERMTELILPILEAGASAIGGCCGTSPAHIQCLRELMAGWRQPPMSIAQPEPALYAQRRSVSLAEAIAGLCEIAGDSDALYDADPDAAAVLLDLRASSPAQIAVLLDEAAAVIRNPLCFRVNDDAQADAALRAYAGVAGIAGASPLLSAKYGAVLL